MLHVVRKTKYNHNMRENMGYKDLILDSMLHDISETATEYCWSTGNYTDDCVCALCLHKDECSGSDVADDD